MKKAIAPWQPQFTLQLIRGIPYVWSLTGEPIHYIKFDEDDVFVDPNGEEWDLSTKEIVQARWNSDPSQFNAREAGQWGHPLQDYFTEAPVKPPTSWYLTSYVSNSGDHVSRVVSEGKILQYISDSAVQGDEICTDISQVCGSYELSNGILDIQLFNPETDIIQ